MAFSLKERFLCYWNTWIHACLDWFSGDWCVALASTGNRRRWRGPPLLKQDLQCNSLIKSTLATVTDECMRPWETPWINCQCTSFVFLMLNKICLNYFWFKTKESKRLQLLVYNVRMFVILWQAKKHFAVAIWQVNGPWRCRIFSAFHEFRTHLLLITSLVSSVSNVIDCSCVRRPCLVLSSSAGTVHVVDVVAKLTMTMSIFFRFWKGSNRFLVDSTLPCCR